MAFLDGTVVLLPSSKSVYDQKASTTVNVLTANTFSACPFDSKAYRYSRHVNVLANISNEYFWLVDSTGAFLYLLKDSVIHVLSRCYA